MVANSASTRASKALGCGSSCVGSSLKTCLLLENGMRLKSFTQERAMTLIFFSVQNFFHTVNPELQQEACEPSGFDCSGYWLPQPLTLSREHPRKAVYGPWHHEK